MQRLNKPLSRETTETVFDSGQYRPVIVTLLPGATLELRLKGTRRRYYLTAGSAFQLAVKAEVEDRRADISRMTKKRRVHRF